MSPRIRQIYSEKYNTVGFVGEELSQFKLIFDYRYKRIELDLEGLNSTSSDEELEKVALETMERYIFDRISELPIRRLMLHYWYIDEVRDHTGKRYKCAQGVVSGHKRLTDAGKIWTSEVKDIKIDEDNNEALIYTQNSLYHCPLEYCNFNKQNENPEFIANYEMIKQKYQGTIIEPSIEPGNVLLVLSNFDEYYFHSLFYKMIDESEPLEFNGYPHIGMMQDSFLIQSADCEFDIRYFPHFENIEFYTTDTKGCPLFIENIGDIVLCARTQYGVIRLEPGERKEVKKENVEEKEVLLANGDLYPAAIY